MKNKRLALAGLCFMLYVLCLLPPSSVFAGEQSYQKFTYNIYWSGIKAGKAELEYIGMSDEFIIRTHATSGSFVSLFYKVDDIARSSLHSDGTPKEYILKVNEGRHRRYKTSEFNKTKEGEFEVVFHNKLENEVMKLNLDQQAYDPLSAFYEMSKRTLEIGTSEFIDIFDNKELFHTEIQVLKKEKIRVPAGEFDTILVKPLLKSEGLFRKTGDMHLWVSDDERKIPVLFTSKAKIGKFYVKLVEGYP